MFPSSSLPRFLFAGALVLLSACHNGGPSPEYLRAREALVAAIEKTNDITYSRPEFDEVERLYRLVPPSANEYEVSQLLAKQIHDARNRPKPETILKRPPVEPQQTRVERRTVVTETRRADVPTSRSNGVSNIGMTEAEKDMENRRRTAAAREPKLAPADKAKELRKIEWERR